MELSKYDVIKRPIITSKSVDLFKRFGQITFEVNIIANKVMIRRAVEEIWNVKVADIRVMKTKGKNKIFARRTFVSPDKKKAIVTLKKGYKIEIPGMFEILGHQENINAVGESSSPRETQS